MRHLPTLALFFLCLSGAARGEEKTWTGGAGAGTPQWQSPSNWGGAAPTSGASLSFPNVANKSATNDFTAGTAFGPITFNASGYVVAGNSLELTGGLFLNGANATAQVALPLSVSTPQPFTVTASTGVLTVTQAISGAGGVIKSGAGLLVLTGTSNYTGSTIISGGAIEADGQLPGTVQMSSGFLTGTGTVGAIAALNQGAVGISPGTSAGAGTLTCTGDLRLYSTDTLYADILSTGSDKLVVNGIATLDGITIVPTLQSTYDPPIGTTFVLIDNAHPIVRPSGDPSDYLSSLTLNTTKRFQISLVGGTDHHDVVLQRVGNFDPTITLSATPSAAINPGDPITFDAVTTGSVDGGTVSFYDGADYLGSGIIGAVTVGKASFSTTALKSGGHHITALFEGKTSTSYAPRRSAIYVLTVNGTATTTTLAAAPNPANPGDLVTMTANVSGTAPTGTVTFYDGTTVLGTSTVSSNAAVLTSSTLFAGSHSLTATFNPTGAFIGSSTAAATTLVINGTATTTTVTTSGTPVVAGATVTFTASVDSGATGGTVTFKDGAAVLGTTAFAGGSVSLATNGLAAGTHSITATYNGTTAFVPSSSSALSQVITAAPDGSGSSGGSSSEDSGGCGLGSGTAALMLGLFVLLGLRLRQN